jgi:hypothetical protein
LHAADFPAAANATAKTDSAADVLLDAGRELQTPSINTTQPQAPV